MTRAMWQLRAAEQRHEQWGEMVPPHSNLDIQDAAGKARPCYIGNLIAKRTLDLFARVPAPSGEGPERTSEQTKGANEPLMFLGMTLGRERITGAL